MKLKRSVVFIFGLAVLLLAAAYFGRGYVRDAWSNAIKPTVPTAQTFEQVEKLAEVPATNTFPSAPAKPPVKKPTTPVDPLAWNGKLPDKVNLAVPFTSQAPKGDWSLPYQEACEEAGMLMVDAYYHGRTEKFAPDEADRLILALIDYENIHYQGKQDMTAQEVVTFIKDYYGYKTVVVRDVTDIEQIKPALALGYPVLVPAYGKALGNPNYRNGGPLYHMLVIKGYLPDGRIITNDSGTHNGADYVYDPQVLFNAMHDWNNGDVPNGAKKMIVIIPNTKI